MLERDIRLCIGKQRDQVGLHEQIAGQRVTEEFIAVVRDFADAIDNEPVTRLNMTEVRAASWSPKKREIGTRNPSAMRSRVSTEGDTNPCSIRESIDRETPLDRASAPAEFPAASLSARICAPIREAEPLRGVDSGCLRRAFACSGSLNGRAVGKGEAIRTCVNLDPRGSRRSCKN
jgi:hypothetical protein